MEILFFYFFAILWWLFFWVSYNSVKKIVRILYIFIYILIYLLVFASWSLCFPRNQKGISFNFALLYIKICFLNNHSWCWLNTNISPLSSWNLNGLRNLNGLQNLSFLWVYIWWARFFLLVGSSQGFIVNYCRHRKGEIEDYIIKCKPFRNTRQEALELLFNF